MSVSNPEPTDLPPADDPSKAELEALRKEKADRERAERDLELAELAELRTYKTAQEAERAKRMPAPKSKDEKVAEKPPEPDGPPPKRRARVSPRWFGESAYEE